MNLAFLGSAPNSTINWQSFIVMKVYLYDFFRILGQITSFVSQDGNEISEMSHWSIKIDNLDASHPMWMFDR